MNKKRGVAVIATLALAGVVAIGATASGGFQTTVQPYAVGIAEGDETSRCSPSGTQSPRRRPQQALPDGRHTRRPRST